MALVEAGAREPGDIARLMAQARRAAEMMKALSHEARLLILCLLSEEEKSVSDLEQRLRLPQAAVSQHLARLRADGLVVARRDGRNIFYRIATPEAAAVIGALYAIYCEGAAGR